MKSIISFLTIVFFSVYLYGQDAPAYEIKKLSETIYELSIDVGGYPEKSLVSIGSDGVLMVDCGSKGNSKALVDALKKLGKENVDIIVYTHSHKEHVSGAIGLNKVPTIIAHTEFRERYLNGPYIFNEYPISIMPNITFNDSLSIWFNNEEVKLKSFAGAHDNSDIIVWFTKSKVVSTAALCNGDHFPSIDDESGDMLKYPEMVGKVIKMLPPDVTLVPGHNKSCNMTVYNKFHDMLVRTCQLVKNEIAKGSSLEKMKKDSIFNEWKNWETYATRDYMIDCWYKALTNKNKQVNNKKKYYLPFFNHIKTDGIDKALEAFISEKQNRNSIYDMNEYPLIYANGAATRAKKYDESVKILEVLLKEFPNAEYAEYFYMFLGNSYKNLKENQKAIKAYNKYLEKMPNDERIKKIIKELQK